MLRVRLALGTGVLGGFITFSSLALETERLLAAGDVTLAGAYGVGSLVLGVLACTAGVALAAAGARRRGVPEQVGPPSARPGSASDPDAP